MTHKLNRKLLLAALILLLISTTSCSIKAGKDSAGRAVVKFHKQLDAEQYHDIYMAGDEEFLKSATEDDLVAYLGAVHQKLGQVKSSSQSGFYFNVNTSGMWITLNYNTEFSGGMAYEQFVWHVQGDRARLYHYQINSRAFLNSDDRGEREHATRDDSLDKVKGGVKVNLLSAEQKAWALAVSALLTERNGERHDLLGGVEPTAENIECIKERLKGAWNIESRADLLSALDWIEGGGQRAEFETKGAYLASLNAEQTKAFKEKKKDDPQATYQIVILEKNYKTLGKKGLLGWDYSRYVSLCRWGYAVGLLKEDEAWERIIPAARLLQKNFASWKELGENYLIGREFWSLEETQSKGLLCTAAYQRLLDHEDSPWKRYAWKTDLSEARERKSKMNG